MTVSGSTYPKRPGKNSLIDLGGLTGRVDIPKNDQPEDPSAKNAAVLGMIPFWDPINTCVGGTKTIRQNAESVIPREPREDDDAYGRRIFHAVMPPFLQRLASQAAGTILRRGIHLEGGDEEYWREWAKDVTGDGTPLNEFARRVLVDALLYGHTSVLVESPKDLPNNLAELRSGDYRPYLCPIEAQQICGWRTEGNRAQADLTQLRYSEVVSEPEGRFGEDVIEQVRVLEPGKYEIWRAENATSGRNAGWYLHESGSYDLDQIPVVTVYSNRLGTLLSRPPLLEVANLNIAYCQRFTDYHHSIHVGSQPIFVLKGFDPDSDNKLGLSVNTAVLLPPDGSADYVSSNSDSFQSQLDCLRTLEEQISSLGISTLARQNITNAAAEAKRLDRIDSDSIMSIISEDLARAITDILAIAADYAGVEPPNVTIPRDYENRLLDGNQITAMLQLQMQNQISQETLLRILQEGEVIPPYVELDKELMRTKDEMEDKIEMDLEQAKAEVQIKNKEISGGVTSGDAAGGGTSGSMTLPTPMRSGKYAD